MLLSLVFIGAILLSGFALSKALEHKAQAEISDRGQMLLQIVNSVRTYTDTHVTTLLTPDADTQSQFRAESIPSFAAREVFELFRQNQEYKNFYYKDAVLNPTNLRDKVAGLFHSRRRGRQFDKLRLNPLLLFNYAHPCHCGSFCSLA